MSLPAFLERFPDDDACWAHLEAVRWPKGPVCPKCGSVNDAHLVGRAHYRRCNACRAKFKATHGTPLEGTHLPLRTWFTALHLVAATSKGVSSVELAGHLGIGQKTAWYLGQRIRRMVEDRDGLLSGIVEVDEPHPGGKKRGRGQPPKRHPDDDRPTARSGTRQSMATVAAEHGGRARVAKGKTRSEWTIAALVLRHPDIGRTVLVTDELPACCWIGRSFLTQLRVNHSKAEHLRVDENAAAIVHTNTAEAFNAAVRRTVIRVWHRFSIKHTNRCLREVSFRWNRRTQDADARLTGLFACNAAQLRWKDLVA